MPCARVTSHGGPLGRDRGSAARPSISCRTLDLDALLAEDSTFYGDLFAHVVQYRGVMYLEDGLHRAVRAALHQRALLHARVLVIK